MCNKIIKALPKIYFALKKDTPQGYNAKEILGNAFIILLHMMHDAVCIMHNACIMMYGRYSIPLFVAANEPAHKEKNTLCATENHIYPKINPLR